MNYEIRRVNLQITLNNTVSLNNQNTKDVFSESKIAYKYESYISSYVLNKAFINSKAFRIK